MDIERMDWYGKYLSDQCESPDTCIGVIGNGGYFQKCGAHLGRYNEGILFCERCIDRFYSNIFATFAMNFMRERNIPIFAATGGNYNRLGHHKSVGAEDIPWDCPDMSCGILDCDGNHWREENGIYMKPAKQ